MLPFVMVSLSYFLGLSPFGLTKKGTLRSLTV